jgi:hypothetical protein
VDIKTLYAVKARVTVGQAVKQPDGGAGLP